MVGKSFGVNAGAFQIERLGKTREPSLQLHSVGLIDFKFELKPSPHSAIEQFRVIGSAND